MVFQHSLIRVLFSWNGNVSCYDLSLFNGISKQFISFSHDFVDGIVKGKKWKMWNARTFDYILTIQFFAVKLVLLFHLIKIKCMFSWAKGFWIWVNELSESKWIALFCLMDANSHKTPILKQRCTLHKIPLGIFPPRVRETNTIKLSANYRIQLCNHSCQHAFQFVK